MWRHQREAVKFALDRSGTYWHMGMGTGKSRCAIELAKFRNCKTVLIVCPLSVVEGWAKQFRLYAESQFNVVRLNKGRVADKADKVRAALRLRSASGVPAAIVVNYESARLGALAKIIKESNWDLLVMDEVHRIKSPGGATSRFLSQVAQKVPLRVGLSGTPMPHSPLDVYAQARAIDPSVFGWSFVSFRKRYATMGGFGGKQVIGYQNQDDLARRLGTFTFQCDRGVLDLPDAVHEVREVELSPKAKKIYAELDREFQAWVGEGEVTAANAMVKLLRLQQVTSGRVQVDHGTHESLDEVDDSKLKALTDLFEDLPRDEPVVVFGRFKSDLQTVHEAAKLTARDSLELSGSVRQLEQWQAGEAPVLAVQIQSGGTGVDLTRAAYCVYLSTGFSLGDYEQSLARVHRPGQDRTVFYYHIVAKDTVDEKVYAALRARKKVVEAILDEVSK
jgi:SNF2 family DNA or RNA helicase